MKAAPEAQKRLLDLAEVDAGLDRLSHRRRSQPDLADVEEQSKKLAQLATQIISAETEAGDLAREQAKAESDVDAVRARVDRDAKRLDSGQVSSPKDLASLQSEIVSLRRRQGDLEEIVLEIMERLEAAQSLVSSLRSEREKVTATLRAAEDRRDAAFAEMDKEHADLQAKRAPLLADIPAGLLALYEKMREQSGMGAALLQGGRCLGCRTTMSIADLNQVRAAAPDEVVRCEECRRILVRTAESGL
ncbi:zinc ribbon domain-containing protein [Microbispora sp. NPDC049125]|uniref:zinc ribbon domain-containing protein n=1 Tax=Microbispora sp. NPDC049125 TaxID=3154929 RepID=UPI00346620CC